MEVNIKIHKGVAVPAIVAWPYYANFMKLFCYVEKFARRKITQGIILVPLLFYVVRMRTY